MRFFFEYLEHIFGDIKPPTWAKVSFVFGVLLVLLVLFPDYANRIINWLILLVINTAPLWLPFILAVVFWQVWLSYRRTSFLSTQKSVLLEIKLPQDIDKSPAAMELVILGLFQTGGQSTWYDRQILGKTRAWFSLELVSVEGKIHFYIWTRDFLKDVVEAAIYSQYPTVEIFEVEDYTRAIPYFDADQIHMFGTQHKYSQSTAFPIRTYIDFKLDENPKEEYKIDPLASVLEYLATLGPGEQMWIQILIRAYKEPQIEGHGIFTKFDFYAEGKERLKKLREEILKEKSESVEGEEREYLRIPARGEQERFNAIDRKLSKQPFECAFRAIYLAKPDAFKGPRIGQMIRIWTPFNFPALNSLGFQWQSGFDFPWQDFMSIRANGRRRKVLEAYRLRSAFFHPNNDIVTQFMSAEELASLFHFPGRVVTAPGLERITSRKATPPPDLPR